jgi:hypothetical protein
VRRLSPGLVAAVVVAQLCGPAFAQVRKVGPRQVAPSTAPKPLPYYERVWVWTTALAVISAGTGLGVGIAARLDFDEAKDLGTVAANRRAWEEVQRDGERKALVANIMFGVGGALAVLSGVLFALELRSAQYDLGFARGRLTAGRDGLLLSAEF